MDVYCNSCLRHLLEILQDFRKPKQAPINAFSIKYMSWLTLVTNNGLCYTQPTIPNISLDGAKVRNYLQMCK